MSKLIGAGRPYQSLVANLRGGSDPSRGINPVKMRIEFRQQHIREIPWAGPGTEPFQVVVDKNVSSDVGPGATTYIGLLTNTVPGVHVAAGGTITVISTDFSFPAAIVLGEFMLTSGQEFDAVAGTPHVGEDITSTAPDNVIVVWKTAGAGLGEGTILVPANLPIAPSSVTVHWTSGAAAYSQTDDGVTGFTGDGNPAGSIIDYTTGAITLDTTALPPDAATPITIDYSEVVTADNIATSLAAAISNLPGFTGTPVGAVVTIIGPNGPAGNQARFEAEYTGAAINFTLVPTVGTLAGGEPFIGPPEIT